MTPAQDAAQRELRDRHRRPAMASTPSPSRFRSQLLTRTGAVEPATSPAATIGVWGTTSGRACRCAATRRRAAIVRASSASAAHRQSAHQRAADRHRLRRTASAWTSRRTTASSSFFLDPSLPRVLNALTGGVLAIPPPPRLDLLPLVQYVAADRRAGHAGRPGSRPAAAQHGRRADAARSASRLGVLGGDAAGFPNGRRSSMTSPTSRCAWWPAACSPRRSPASTPTSTAGWVTACNVNDAPYGTLFPYSRTSPSGRDRRHIDPTEPGCTAGGGGTCPGQ